MRCSLHVPTRDRARFFGGAGSERETNLQSPPQRRGPQLEDRPRNVKPTTAPVPARRSSSERPSWQADLAPYARPHLGRSVLDLATSVVPYLALSVAMYLALKV